MNIMMLTIGSQGGAMPGTMLGDSCAVFLFLSGAVSLSIAAYLLYKTPKAQPARYVRRH